MINPFGALLVIIVMSALIVVIFLASRSGGKLDLPGENARPLVELLRLRPERVRQLKRISNWANLLFLVFWTISSACAVSIIVQEIIRGAR